MSIDCATIEPSFVLIETGSWLLIFPAFRSTSADWNFACMPLLRLMSKGAVIFSLLVARSKMPSWAITWAIPSFTGTAARTFSSVIRLGLAMSCNARSAFME
ncbi:hypothetical protein D3C78_1486860 [compost metagenome]